MITIYGASDDLVEVDGCKGADEFNVYGEGKNPVMWRGDFISPDGGQMRIYAIHDGCWHFSIGQVDEEVPLPDWKVSISQHERGYSTLITIAAPEGTRVTNIGPEK